MSRRAVDVAAVARQYRVEQLSLRQIGRLHGVSHETVRNLLAEQGVPLREPHPVTPVDEGDISCLRAEGMTIAEIAKQLGVSEQTIYRRLGGNY